MKQKLLTYITYQTFPAETANSLQTISNIKYFVKNGFKVSLYFPLRDKSSSDNIDKISEYYSVDKDFKIFGLKHNLPFGKIKFLEPIWFHISHFLWSRRNVNNILKTSKNDEIYFTRSDWVLYFLVKKNKNVIFECHQVSKIRNFVLSRVAKNKNVKVIFLNKTLKENYKHLNLKSIVLHSAVDPDLFLERNIVDKNEKKVVFVGSLLRFGKARGVDFIIKAFTEYNDLKDYTLEIIGGPKEEAEKLKNLLLEEDVENISITGRLDRKSTIKKIQESSIGILINSDESMHSREFTSPLKYFEYIYGGLAVVAADFPSHRILPNSEMIKYFTIGNFDEFIESVLTSNVERKETNLTKISLDYRAKEIIKFIEST